MVLLLTTDVRTQQDTCKVYRTFIGIYHLPVLICQLFKHNCPLQIQLKTSSKHIQNTHTHILLSK